MSSISRLSSVIFSAFLVCCLLSLYSVSTSTQKVTIEPQKVTTLVDNNIASNQPAFPGTKKPSQPGDKAVESNQAVSSVTKQPSQPGDKAVESNQAVFPSGTKKTFSVTSPSQPGDKAVESNQAVSPDTKKTLNVIYHQHLRKSGGTSLNKYLGKDADGFHGNFFFIHGEMRAFPFPCLSHPNASNTLFVTTIRDPVSRWQSELNYMNVLGDQKVDLHNNSAVRQALENWILSPKIKSNRLAIAKFVPEMMTRFLASDCECVELNKIEEPKVNVIININANVI